MGGDHGGSGSGQVLIMKQFFENIPKELEEAAIVDGASQP
ncbi:maltose/maltodextrin ABC transporter permease protein MalG [Vibrio astriarenae]|nr:maltose/maltodextrin ABC transporter permease protein MalG [Vibrio sp. C7]